VARRAHRFTAILAATALVVSVAMPSASLAAFPGGYYSVGVYPDVPWAFSAPGDISIATSGDVYVADTSNCRIKRLSAAGVLLSVWGSRGSGPGQFSGPQGVVSLPSGRVVVADTGNNRLQLFEADGTHVATWGSAGAGSLQFSAPSGLGADTAGNIYVADAGNGRVQKVSSAGVFMLAIGTYGPGNGQLDNPRDVAVDTSGNIYVADTNNRRIEKFTAAGAYVTYWGPEDGGSGGTTYSRYSTPSGISVDSVGNLFIVDPGGSRVTPSNPASAIYFVERCGPTGSIISQWGTSGTGSGQYLAPPGPRGIAARPGGGAYVADTGNNRIEILSATGAVDAIWTGRGSTAGKLDSPQGVAIGADGSSYVADTLNNRVQVFDSAGTFVRAFGTSGSGLGQLNAPTDISLDASGTVWVVDKGNNRVQSFTPTGTALSTFGSSGTTSGRFAAPEGIWIDSAGAFYIADTGNARVQKFSSAGVWAMSFVSTGIYTLSAPADVAVDDAGDVYIVDRTQARVRVFSAAGAGLRTIGASGITDGRFTQPTGIAVYGSSIFVADSGNARIQRLTTAGDFETKFGTPGAGSGELAWPARLAVDPSGRVLVAEQNNHRLQMFAYDNIAPLTTLTGFDNYQTYSAPVTMTLAATDSGSGVAVTKYTMDGGALTTYTAPVQISAEGQHTVRYRSVDRMGSSETTKTRVVTIDTIPPSGSLVVAGGQAYVATTTVHAVNTFSDAVEMRFNIDGTWPQFQNFEPDLYLALPGEGMHVVRAEYRDIAGNTASKQDTVTVDLTAPTSEATVSPAEWSNTHSTVTLTATDTASGVGSIRYRVGATGVESVYAGPFDVGIEGTTDVYFRSIDAVGNAEETQTVPVYVDLTPPTGTLVIADGNTLVDTSTVSLESDVPDALAMRVDPGDGFGEWFDYDPLVDAVVPHEGTIALRTEYRDRAGNTLLLGGSLDVDLIAPTTLVTGIPGGEASAPVTVTLTATDTVSGVNKTFYQLDSGPIETYVAPFVVSNEGTTVVTYWSADIVGHAEEPKTAKVRIDTTAPTGTFVLDADAPYALTQTVSADSVFADAVDMAFDDGSGYGAWVTYADSFALTLSGEGTHTVEAAYRDDLGNTRVLVDSIFVDLADPETVVSLEDTEWSPEPVTVTLTASDTGSGVTHTFYRIGAVATTYTAPFEISAEGTTTIEYWSVDRSGRVEEPREVDVRVDTIAPSGTMRVARGAHYAVTHSIPLDSVVVGATEMQVDSGAGYGPWVAYAPQTTVALAVDRTYTVTARYRDAAGNLLELSDSVTLDTAAPALSGISVTVDSWRRPKRPTGTVRAVWSATEAAPVTGYSYVIDRIATTPADTTVDTTARSLSTTVPTHGIWYFHIRARDAAGNWSVTRTVRFEVTSRRTSGRVFK